MTVCIAALCDNGDNCVLVSDQMTTAHFPIGYEYETDEVGKIVPLKGQTYVLASGDVLFAHQVIGVARDREEDSGKTQVATLAEAVRMAYQAVRRTRIAQTQLEPRRLSWDSYYGHQQQLVPALVQAIDTQLTSFSPNVDLIVAGKDNTGCHVYTIHNPGVLLCHDPVGFAAIGSGGPHAIYSLIELAYKKSLDKEAVMEMVEKAKKRSEVAPGVGEATEALAI